VAVGLRSLVLLIDGVLDALGYFLDQLLHLP